MIDIPKPPETEKDLEQTMTPQLVSRSTTLSESPGGEALGQTEPPAQNGAKRLRPGSETPGESVAGDDPSPIEAESGRLTRERSYLLFGQQEITDFVVFTLGGQIFGVDISQVQEVVRLQEITRVPNSAPYVQGVMNLRGKIIPVIDLHRRFGLAPVDLNAKTRIIVMKIKGQAIGFLVEIVDEIIQTRTADLDTSTRIASKIDSDYMRGVIKIANDEKHKNFGKNMILLDLDDVLDQASWSSN